MMFKDHIHETTVRETVIASFEKPVVFEKNTYYAIRATRTQLTCGEECGPVWEVEMSSIPVGEKGNAFFRPTQPAYIVGAKLMRSLARESHALELEFIWNKQLDDRYQRVGVEFLDSLKLNLLHNIERAFNADR